MHVHLSRASHQNVNVRLTCPFIRPEELVDCCHFRISSSEKWYVNFCVIIFLSSFIRTILRIDGSSGRPTFSSRAVDYDRSKLLSAWLTSDFIIVVSRRKVLRVLVNATTRRTLCVVVVDGHRITFKSPSAPNADTQARNSVIVSKTHNIRWKRSLRHAVVIWTVLMLFLVFVLQTIGVWKLNVGRPLELAVSDTWRLSAGNSGELLFLLFLY